MVKYEIEKIADKYFKYLSKRYPVMCLSDEFSFLPRAKDSINHLDLLDSLNEYKIHDDISYVMNLQKNLDNLALDKTNLELLIDYTLLRQSMATYLIEFSIAKRWQFDPTLYLKIILLAIEQFTRKHTFSNVDINLCFLSRLAYAPRLLNEARINIGGISPIYLSTAMHMINVSIAYLKKCPSLLSIGRRNRAFEKDCVRLIRTVSSNLSDLKTFLKGKTSHHIKIKSKKILNLTLKDSFSYRKTLKDIFDISEQEYFDTLRELQNIAHKISPGKTWQHILSRYTIKAKNKKELLKLYSGQVSGLKKFFKEKDIIGIPERQSLLVKETPSFMIPIRASASYACPISTNPLESGIFYLTPFFGQKTKKNKRFTNIHNEYIFVTAHETFPGHHLLDYIRRHLKNPIRQQIESPFFYEGWASYVEKLIWRLGYIKDPSQELIYLRRQAWRAVRAMLDTGIHIKRLKPKRAEMMLRKLGYAPAIVKTMVSHYMLTCGYQLCYTMGKHEIEKLERKYVPRLGVKKFYKIFLEGGQIPFHFIAKRLEHFLCKKNS